jgi:aspartyl-tRNA(Asn)/glutamyl-tRNA(Gln) amidotransferase subunit C
MSLTIQDVQKVARLARLELSLAEMEQTTKQLGAILEYAEKLNVLDITNVEPTAHVLPIQNVLREDVLKPSLPREQALANAPDPAKGCFRVPKILEG